MPTAQRETFSRAGCGAEGVISASGEEAVSTFQVSSGDSSTETRRFNDGLKDAGLVN